MSADLPAAAAAEPPIEAPLISLGGRGSGSVAFDRIAKQYDETRGGIERGRRAAAALGPWLPKHGPVLEVGVGTGIVAAAVATQTRPVVGIDLSLPMLSRAKERLGGRVALGDGLHLPIADNAVPAAYVVHVLHLVANVQEALAELYRVIAAGGRLLIVCTAEPQERSDADKIIQKLYRRLHGERPDAADRVVTLAETAGFTVEHASTFGHPSSASPTHDARLIEQRTWSFLWDLDDGTWAGKVLPAVQALRRLPEPDRDRHGIDARTLLVLRCP